MKKLVLSVIALCMIFSLASCGNDADKPGTKKDPDNWTEKDFEDALNALDSAAKSSATPVPEATADPALSFEAKQEIIDAAWDSGLVQIDDKLIQLPLRLSEWVDMGMDYEVEFGNKSKDFLFTQNERVALNLTYNGEELGSLIFTKQTETPETVQQMNPLIEQIYKRDQSKKITIYFPGGLTFGEPDVSIEEKLGKAAEAAGYTTYAYGQSGAVGEYMSYQYGWFGSTQTDMHYNMEVSVDRNTQTVSGFGIGKSIQESDRKNLSTLSFENVPNIQTSDIHNVTLLWASEYKQIPGIVRDERCAGSVLNDNGKKYYMSLSFSMLAQKYANPYEYISYGDPILDTTDENGINRKVYNAGYAYIVVCSTDVHIFKATIELKDMSDSSADALAALQDLVIEIANSVQY